MKEFAEKMDNRVFDKMLKYNPKTQNLWDIVGFFENEREKLRVEIAQYNEDIASSKATLKAIRAEISQARMELIEMSEEMSANKPQDNALKEKIAELELENAKLLVELRDLKNEYELNIHLKKAKEV